MAQEIRLEFVNFNPSGTIEVGYTWNGAANSAVYASGPGMVEDNSQLLQSSSEAVRWLLYYLFTLGATPETLSSYAGKKLVVDIGPAVQQTIALV